MTQYLLSVIHAFDGPQPAEDELQQIYKDVDDFNQKLQDEKLWVFGGGLTEPSSATVVTPKDGDIITTDGPYAEAKEQLGGFWIIEAPDLDVALKLAGEGAAACRNAVEVRPFQSEDG